MSISRRKLLQMLPAAAFGQLLGKRFPNSTSSPFTQYPRQHSRIIPKQLIPASYSGENLENWLVTLGDGIYPLDGPNQVTAADIRTDHSTGRSELLANINNRLIKAHNITYYPIEDDTAFSYLHEGGFEFRIPYTPKGDLEDEFNGHTFDAGFFIWDGNVTRFDYGSSFQWVISPFDYQNYSKLFVWSTEQSFLGSWVDTGLTLDVDQEWHTFFLSINFTNQRVTMMVDDMDLGAPFTAISKSIDWTPGIGSRLQAEIVGLFPGVEAVAPFPIHKAQIRNWYWNWKIPPYELYLPQVINP